MSEQGWQYYQGLKIFLTVVSVLRVIIPKLNMWYEEEMMSFLSAFDLLLLFWIPVLNVFGQQIKKAKLPKWMPPTPVLVLFLSFIICAVSGCIRCEAVEGTARFAQIVGYSLGNGCLIGLIALSLYDVFTGFVRTQWVCIKSLFDKIITKIKEKRNGKEK